MPVIIGDDIIKNIKAPFTGDKYNHSAGMP